MRWTSSTKPGAVKTRNIFYMQTFPSIVFKMYALFKVLVKSPQDGGANNKLVDIVSALTFFFFYSSNLGDIFATFVLFTPVGCAYIRKLSLVQNMC